MTMTIILFLYIMDSKLKSVFLELVGKHKDILGLSDETVDAIMKDCAGSEDVNPEMDKPEMDKPEMDEPEMDKPEMDKPEMDKPEMDKPEMDKPEMDKPEDE
jgi:hypothetical protein